MAAPPHYLQCSGEIDPTDRRGAGLCPARRGAAPVAGTGAFVRGLARRVALANGASHETLQPVMPPRTKHSFVGSSPE